MQADEAKQAAIDADHEALERETRALLDEIDRLAADKELLNEQVHSQFCYNNELVIFVSLDCL